MYICPVGAELCRAEDGRMDMKQIVAILQPA
jgi:hypothetical protein